MKTHTHVITIQKSCQCQKRIKQTVCATSLFTHYFFDITKCKHAEVKLYEKLNNDETILKAQRYLKEFQILYLVLSLFLNKTKIANLFQIMHK